VDLKNSLDIEWSEWKTFRTRLKELKKLEMLRIRNVDVDQFPAIVYDLPDLQVLALQGSRKGGRVGQFPIGISKMKQLRRFRLINMAIPGLPEDLARLPTLEEIDLDHTALPAFPVAKGDYAALNSLSLISCELAAIPDEVGRLPSLRFLTVSSNPLTQIPSSLADAKNLKILSVDGCRLERIPGELFSLPALVKIDLTGNTFAQDDYVALERLAKKHPKIEVLMPRNGAKVPTPRAVSPAPLSAAIVKELDRLGLTAGKPRPNPFEPNGPPIPPPPPPREVKIAGVVWPVPPATAEIFARLSGAILAPFLDEKERERIELGLDKGALAEYECIHHAPYVQVAMTKNYFFLLLRLDDEKPHDPTLYVLDHEDFQEHEAGSLSSLIAWLKAAQPAPEKDATG